VILCLHYEFNVEPGAKRMRLTAFRFSIAIIVVIAVMALLFPPGIPDSRISLHSKPGNAFVEEQHHSSELVPPNPARDAEFERFVHLQTIATAWAKRDSMMMTDITLQLIEGERVLRRPHPVVTSAETFSVAMWLTTENNDEASQRRLTMAAKQSGHSIVDEHELCPDLMKKLDQLATEADWP
jgi:hypothetical protein